MKAKELREKSIEELQAQIEDINQEQFKLKCTLSLEKKLDHPHLIKKNKKTKARILTVLREKKVG